MLRAPALSALSLALLPALAFAQVVAPTPAPAESVGSAIWILAAMVVVMVAGWAWVMGARHARKR